MLIVYEDLGPGWSPIAHMVRLCAELLEADLLFLSPHAPSHGLKYLSAYLPRRKGSETCLVITGGPQHLPLLFRVDGWRYRFKHIAAWVIDGFWTDYIPHAVRFRGMFDQFFITTEEDVSAWEALTKRPTTAIPWGSDVFGHGSCTPCRPVDLLRVGRQPPEWDDDPSTKFAAAKRRIRFNGRPTVSGDLQTGLMRTYSQAKFTLAFSNAIHRSEYTHPTRAYLTGRWTDSLAAGAIVAGIPPRSPTIDQLLWPSATLDLGSINRDEGLEVLSAELRTWRPERASENYQMSLRRLDWRWRFLEIARRLDEPSFSLLDEIRDLQAKIANFG